MTSNFRFAVIGDPHIAVPHTIWNHPSRFHLVEISIPALEIVLQHLQKLDLDFLLIPGDLTQHGEVDNHLWLQQRLKSLPFPVYVVPGNHDVPCLFASENRIASQDFPLYYQDLGYSHTEQLYYQKEILPQVQLIALNSNQFNSEGKQIGSVDDKQLTWLENILSELKNQFVLVMIHHNVVEHIPGQSVHELGKRYMLENAKALKAILRKFGVKLIFTGHLHVQDIASEQGLYEITTGSLVSYPHPYRVIELQTDELGKKLLKIDSYKVESVPGWENLQQSSREWMGDRSFPFMVKLLTGYPLSLPSLEAEKLAHSLRYFWADIAKGDTVFDFPDFPTEVRNYFKKFSAVNEQGKPVLIDNNATLVI